MAEDHRLAVATTLHPLALPYLSGFLASVRAQDDADFDLWMALDGVPSGVAEEALDASGGRHGVKLFPVAHDSPARHRSDLLRLLCRRYDAIVLVDADDELAPGRVGSARRALRTADVQACGMELMDESGAPLGRRFGADGTEAWEQVLARSNVFGFGNSAYRSAALATCLPLPDEAVLIDWWVISRALAAGARLAFEAEPLMRYRQYGGTMGHVVPPFSEEQVRAVAQRMLLHYALLERDPRPLPAAFHRAVRDARADVEAFAERVLDDGERLRTYLDAINGDDRVWRWCEFVADRRFRDLWTTPTA